MSVYFLGATEAVLGRVVERVRREFPALRVAGARNGYFDPSAEPDIASDIRRSGADLLFIAMTSPRKEKFIGTWGDATGCKVLHGVGGSFDVFAGHVARAPEAWQRLGLEWLYRVVQEPRRLWWRYARTNTIFAGLLATSLARRLTSRLTARGRSPVSWTD
jgi:N-acetylglucosaminyldiphosphoundecaprenol N-acetyl-beta-D-mannosaminyltransferase